MPARPRSGPKPAASPIVMGATLRTYSPDAGAPDVSEPGASVQMLPYQVPQSPARMNPNMRNFPDTTGALPEMTPAEELRNTEEDFQRQVMRIRQVIEDLNSRIADMRRQTVQPPIEDMDRLDNDIRLADEAVIKLSSLELSPLSQLQRTDIQDRLFQTKIAYEIARRRWAGEEKVFGIDFFKSAPPLESSDHGRPRRTTGFAPGTS